MHMTEKSANPAPLGLLGFGITTVLLNFVHNFRLTSSIDPMILGMGIFYGGLAQVIAGVLEYKRGNTFGTVAFTSYGLFWWSFVFMNMLPQSTMFRTYIAVQSEAMMTYFFMWGLFTLMMFFGTLKKNRALQFVFMSLAILFFLLAAKSAIQSYYPTALSPSNTQLLTQLIGFEGTICGLSAVYLAIAEVLNEEHGKTILPICPTS